MKTIKSKILIPLLSGTLIFGTAWAHESKSSDSHKEHHLSSASTKAIDVGGSTMAINALEASLDSVNNELLKGKLNRIHQFAEAMNKAVVGLDRDSSLDAAKKKRVQGYIKNVAKLTDSMHDAADEKKLDETKKWAKKLKVQADLLKQQFKIK